jgi:hypothetical protein
MIVELNSWESEMKEPFWGPGAGDGNDRRQK